MLKGFDPLVNVVLDECIEFIRGEKSTARNLFNSGNSRSDNLPLVLPSGTLGIRMLSSGSFRSDNVLMVLPSASIVQQDLVRF